MKIGGRQITDNQEIMLSILDILNLSAWLQTEDGRKGTNRPESVLSRFKGENTKKGFNSPEEMEEARRRIIEKARKEPTQ